MRTIDLSTTAWRKSSYSNQDGGECVEISDAHATAVPVRDSKTPHSPALVIPNDSWSAFITAVKSGKLSG
ncbi:DUF397 domain-containing protein [Streptomyces sp. MMS24-I2-30]|uniref:DUF397 domain-containing protein n=1 Tax=Streptomyces sp. MMS24-I2-30 TaxID=3351564 RepID=UPI0038968FDF